MDDAFNPFRGGDLPEREAQEHIDPFLAQWVEKSPWELRAAQWKARALAEMAFGGEVGVSLVGRPGYTTFRGILYLQVPFRDLDDHTSRQTHFLSWAGEDPVLSKVPLVFVFEPIPVTAL